MAAQDSALLTMPEPRVAHEEAANAIEHNLFVAEPAVCATMQRILSVWQDVGVTSLVQLGKDEHGSMGPWHLYGWNNRQIGSATCSTLELNPSSAVAPKQCSICSAVVR